MFALSYRIFLDVSKYKYSKCILHSLTWAIFFYPVRITLFRNFPFLDLPIFTLPFYLNNHSLISTSTCLHSYFFPQVQPLNQSMSIFNYYYILSRISVHFNVLNSYPLRTSSSIAPFSFELCFHIIHLHVLDVLVQLDYLNDKFIFSIL